jgi:hypothetical protein
VPAPLRSLRIEDGILAAWVGVVQPLVASTALGEAAASAAAGTLMMLAAAAAIVCLGTRPPDQPRVTFGEVPAPRWLFAGPLVGALGLVAGEASDRLAPAGAAWLGWLLPAAAIGAIAANRWLPVVPRAIRRALVLPFVLVCATFWNEFAAGVLDGIDVTQLTAAIGTEEASFVAFVVVLLLGGLAAFYTMLVVAPRELADPEPGSGWRWALRFVVFLAASLTGIGWLRAIAG